MIQKGIGGITATQRIFSQKGQGRSITEKGDAPVLRDDEDPLPINSKEH